MRSGGSKFAPGLGALFPIFPPSQPDDFRPIIDALIEAAADLEYERKGPRGGAPPTALTAALHARNHMVRPVPGFFVLFYV